MVLHSLMMGGLLLSGGVGWRPLPDGRGMEYLIQLSPTDVEAMKMGEPWMTDIPASVGDVRAYRIMIGTGDLPREAPPPALPPQEEEPAAGASGPSRMAPEPAARPLPERQALYLTPDPDEAEPADGDGAVPAGEAPAPAPPSRPWMLLVGTALALAGSLGGNAYLLWGLREAHRRYHELATRCPDAAGA